VFRHQGQQVVWDTAARSSTDYQYAAFYADVQHELRPVTAGMRIVLVYNLVRMGGHGRLPAPADNAPLVAQLHDAVQQWEAQLAAREHGVPRMLCARLQHQYTEAGLSFAALKGADARMVQLLAGPAVGLDVHVALLTRTDVYEDTAAEDREMDNHYDDYSEDEGEDEGGRL
jgi:hypothetical protein